MRISPPLAAGPARGLMALEPRMLFDGAGMASVDAAIAPAMDGHDVDGTDGPVLAKPAVETRAEAPALLIVDPTVGGWQALVADAADGVIVYVLDPQADGVAQIASAVLAAGEISSLHIVSHGESGRLQLGSRSVDAQSIAQYQDEWARIGGALVSDADIVLYGCDVASGELGAAFISALALATSADVAASDDATGAAELGGDWELESSTGSIETSIVFGQKTIEQWQGLLLSVAPEISIVSSDVPLTTGSDAISGETMRLRYVVELVEGTDTNAIVLPSLPTGLQYLNDGQTMVGIVSDSASNSSTLGAGPVIADGGAPLTPSDVSETPSFVLPGTSITDGTGTPLGAGAQASGNDPQFRLGDLTNNDVDADREFIVIEFNVLVATDGSASLPVLGDYQANAIVQGTSNTVTINRLGLITGSLWDDTLDPDQTVDTSPTENVLDGVRVDILYAGADNIFGNGDDASGFATTSVTGAYAFGALAAGNYRISVATTQANPASGPLAVYFDRAGSGSMTDGMIDLSLVDGETRTDQDFGYIKQNATPTLSTPASLSVQQDTSLAINGANTISADDPDLAESFNPASAYAVRLDVSAGTLSLSASGAAIITGNGSASILVSGTMTDVNASIASLSYQGGAGYTGADTLVVRVDDQGSIGDADGDGVPGETVDDNLFATSSVPITVTAAPVVNAAPVAAADTRTTDEDSAFTGQAINPSVAQQAAGDATDTDPDLPSDTIQVCGVAAGLSAGPLSGQVGTTVAGTYGDLVLQADGSYSYTPNAAANALSSTQTVQDVFTYTICDVAGATSSAQITVTVQGADEVAGTPVANPDLRQVIAPVAGASASVAGNAVSAGQPGEQADTDPDGDPLTVTGVQAGVGAVPPAAGVGASLTGDWGVLIMQSDGSYSYQVGTQAQALAPGQTADDTFSYQVSDPSGQTASTTLVVRITGVNDAPSAPNVSHIVPIDALAGTESCRIPPVPAPTDPDPGQVLSTIVSSLPPAAQGQFLLNGVAISVGQSLSNADLQNLCFVPHPDVADLANGQGVLPSSVLGLTVSDDQGASTSGSVTVALQPRPVAPNPGDEPTGSPGTGQPGSSGLSKPPSGPVDAIAPTPADLTRSLLAVAGLSESDRTHSLADLPLPELDVLSPLALKWAADSAESDPARTRVRTAAVQGDASKAIVADEDCVPEKKSQPRPKAVKRSVLSDEAGVRARSFSKQVDKERNRFKPPVKVKPRVAKGRIC